MNIIQYKNNIIKTLALIPRPEKADRAEFARRVFASVGITLPTGDCGKIRRVLTECNFMGWSRCTPTQAQESAEIGIPAVGVALNDICIIMPQAAVATVSDSLVGTAEGFGERVEDPSFFSYRNYANDRVMPVSDFIEFWNYVINLDDDMVCYPENVISPDTRAVFRSNYYVSDTHRNRFVPANITVQSHGAALACLVAYMMYKAGKACNVPIDIYYVMKHTMGSATDGNLSLLSSFNVGYSVGSEGGRVACDGICYGADEVKRSVSDGKGCIVKYGSTPRDYALIFGKTAKEGLSNGKPLSDIIVMNPAEGVVTTLDKLLKNGESDITEVYRLEYMPKK